jgi:hypothetical protein
MDIKAQLNQLTVARYAWLQRYHAAQEQLETARRELGLIDAQTHALNTLTKETAANAAE